MVLIADRPYQDSSVTQRYIQRSIRAIEAKAKKSDQIRLENLAMDANQLGKDFFRETRMSRLAYDPDAVPLN